MRRPARKPGTSTPCRRSLGLGDMRNKYSITMAPRVAKGKVFIGGSGGEFGVRGWIAAYDAETGKEVWRFWTVPGDPAKGFETPAQLEQAAKTWDGECWKSGRRRHRVGCGRLRSGDRPALFRHRQRHALESRVARRQRSATTSTSASIIAVKPDTGEYVWHYQDTPGDTWDYDAVSPMVTADLDDRRREEARADPAVEERLPLRARSRDRQAAQRRSVHRSELGHRRRPEDRPAHRGAGRALREGTVEPRAGRAGRPHLASECVQPGNRARLHPDLGELFDDGESAARQRAARRRVQPRCRVRRPRRSDKTSSPTTVRV